jgi:small redox-active disulfide protein 2
MTIKVLGACCQRSKDTFENTKQAVKELGLDITVENIGSNVEIAKYGVMSTPALVIDEQVVAYGRMLRVSDAKKLIEKVMQK